MARLYQQADFPIGIIRKRCLIVVVGVPANRKHETEPRFVIRRLRREGVGWGLEQVNIRAGQIINQVEIV